MCGNVCEWCEDDWHNIVNNVPKDGSACVDQPKRGSCRVGRGGSWGLTAEFCRVSDRNNWYPGRRSAFVGFRLASFPQ